LNITVMLGGPSAEREVSLRSGAAVARRCVRSATKSMNSIRATGRGFAAKVRCGFSRVARDLRRGRHGSTALDELGAIYTGCDAESSRVAFDKVLTKKRCVKAKVPTAKFLVVNSEKTPWPENWQPPLVVKPVRQGRASDCNCRAG